MRYTEQVPAVQGGLGEREGAVEAADGKVEIHSSVAGVVRSRRRRGQELRLPIPAGGAHETPPRHQSV